MSSTTTSLVRTREALTSILTVLVCYPYLPSVCFHTDVRSQGRTARIGNEGIATSLYNHEKNSDIAQDLVKVLMENKQSIPDFLEEMKPEGELVFDDDNSEEDEEVATGAEPAAASKEEPVVEAPAAGGDEFSW